jgi:hypothetical protein
MKWIKATERLPKRLERVYLKIVYKHRTVCTVGFYSDEFKQFLAEGGMYQRKYVLWLDEEIKKEKLNICPITGQNIPSDWDSMK